MLLLFEIQSVEVSTEIRESLDATPKEAGVSQVPEMAVASSKKAETQSSAVLGEVSATGTF